MAMSSKDYWIQRERENLEKNLKTEAEYYKEIEDIYRYTMGQIQKEIDSFYAKYASKEGITIAEAKKRASKLDMEEFSRKAKKYVEEKNFSKQANDEMRLYNLTMKVNRLELLKAQIGLELVAGFDELQQFYEEKLTERTIEEFQRQAGILGLTILDNAKMAEAIVNASFKNATFSERIWAHQDLLRAELEKLLRTGLIQGKSSRELARRLRKVFDTSIYNSERLLRTELARVQTEAQKQSYIRNGNDEYEYMAVNPMGPCSVCKELNGKVFKVKDMMPGENAPPLHPNCHCTTAPHWDREEFDRYINSDTDLSFADWKNRHKLGSGNDSTINSKPPKPVRVGKLNDMSESNIRKVLMDWESKIIDQDFETAIIITKDGDIFRIDGDKNSVNINGLDDTSLSGAWMTHNHPRGETRYSFSSFDISEALRHKFSLLRGVDEIYTYEYKTTLKTIDPDFNKIYNLFGEEYRNKAYEAGLKDEIDIDLDEYDFICKLLAKDYNFEYERKKK